MSPTNLPPLIGLVAVVFQCLFCEQAENRAEGLTFGSPSVNPRDYWASTWGWPHAQGWVGGAPCVLSLGMRSPIACRDACSYCLRLGGKEGCFQVRARLKPSHPEEGVSRSSPRPWGWCCCVLTWSLQQLPVPGEGGVGCVQRVQLAHSMAWRALAAPATVAVAGLPVTFMTPQRPASIGWFMNSYQCSQYMYLYV